MALLDLSAPGTSPVVLPGTDFASGVSPGPTSDEVYYTLNGDTRVYRRVLSTGDQSVVHDFGAAGIARDVHVAGGRLTAVVGGRVNVLPRTRRSVRSSGTAAASSTSSIWRPVATSRSTTSRASSAGPCSRPTGDRVVAEGYPLIISPMADTTVGRSGDLFLFTAP